MEFYEKLGFGGFREKNQEILVQLNGDIMGAWWFGTMEFYDFPETVGNFIIPMAMWWLTITYYNYNWLVVWNMTFIFPNSWDDDSI